MKTQTQKSNTINMVSTALVIFCLQFNLIFAANTADNNKFNNHSVCKNCESNDFALLLAPSTPMVATFSDEVATTYINLAPAMPVEATFEDVTESNRNVTFNQLAPSTPTEASFEDLPGSANWLINERYAPVSQAFSDYNK
jgi:hypothetical protein